MKKRRYHSLYEVCQTLETLPVQGQKLVEDMIYGQRFARSHKKDATVLVDNSGLADLLVEKGFAVDTDDINLAVGEMKQRDLIAHFNQAGITRFHSRKKADLAALAVNELTPEQASAFMEGVHVLLVSPEIEPFYRKLYTYLKRKFDRDAYYNPDTGEMVDHPYGAHLVEDETGEHYEWPDDEVTVILEEFGYEPK